MRQGTIPWGWSWPCVVTSPGPLGTEIENTLEAATWQKVWLLAEGLTQHIVAL